MNAKLKNAPALKAELPVSLNVPYRAHIAKDTIKLHSGDYLRVFRLDGIAHESADDEDINMWHNQLNTLLRNIASPNIAIWTHIIRRQENTYPGGHFPEEFTRALNEKYKRRIIDGQKMLVNELYISVIYRPKVSKVGKAFGKLESVSKESLVNEQATALEKLDDISATMTQALKRYAAVPLKVYEENGLLFSEMLEFLGYLINGEWQKAPLCRGDVSRFLPTSRLFFGSETIALRSAEKTTLGTMLTFQEYPNVTGPGMLDALLELPCEFILTQSFVFMPKTEATGMLKRDRDIMINAGDLAQSQINEIDGALDDLTSNKFVMGKFHLSLLIFGDDPKTMRDSVGSARSALSDTGARVVPEDLANEAAFWAQLPGNFDLRTRPSPITSLNFAAFSAFHNFPSGKAKHNHWGDAVALMKTTSGTPYYFNFHAQDLGNTIITGPSGSGKTVVQGFLLAMLQKFQPTCVFFDKDRGAEIFVRAMKGYYQPLLTGQPTGWNPLRMDVDDPAKGPGNRAFLESWLKLLARKPSGEPLTVLEEREIIGALNGVLQLTPELRRIGQVLAFLDPTNPEGVFYRIQRWTKGFSQGWVFDHENDSLDMQACKLFGFDMTELLENDEVRTPSLFYLMYRMEEVIDGRRFVCFMDEFWKMLKDEVFRDFAENKLKTIRKLNGFLVFGTQDVRDTLSSPIAHTIIGQCPTHMFMGNPKAHHDDYTEGFHLSEREYEIVKGLTKESRRFLIKQGQNSIVAEMNLRGFDDELAILSGTASNVELVEKVIAEVGDDPEVWVPVFQKRRVAA